MEFRWIINYNYTSTLKKIILILYCNFLNVIIQASKNIISDHMTEWTCGPLSPVRSIDVRTIWKGHTWNESIFVKRKALLYENRVNQLVSCTEIDGIRWNHWNMLPMMNVFGRPASYRLRTTSAARLRWHRGVGAVLVVSRRRTSLVFGRGRTRHRECQQSGKCSSGAKKAK